jgi:apolipoprotein N-acyltransferase
MIYLLANLTVPGFRGGRPAKALSPVPGSICSRFGSMESSRRSGFEGLSIGFLIVAFAVSLLAAWALDDWILTIPIFLLAAGIFYVALSFLVDKSSQKISPYYLFWGATIAILGGMWLINRQYPGSLTLLVIVFILWIGLMAVFLSIPRIRKSRV